MKKDNIKAEFDLIADEYYSQLSKSVQITGESPEYFSEYKIRDLHNFIDINGEKSNYIFDFGCGIGNSIPYMRKYFKESHLICGDVSERSIEIAKQRFPGNETYNLIDEKIHLSNQSQDIVFTACVFHHIDENDHVFWLNELRRITKNGGIITIFEHNPYNPLTLKVVKDCPFDVNAKLISSKNLIEKVEKAGWTFIKLDYKLFFPAFLKYFRRYESKLANIPIGGQYMLIAKNNY